MEGLNLKLITKILKQSNDVVVWSKDEVCFVGNGNFLISITPVEALGIMSKLAINDTNGLYRKEKWGFSKRRDMDEQVIANEIRRLEQPLTPIVNTKLCIAHDDTILSLFDNNGKCVAVQKKFCDIFYADAEFTQEKAKQDTPIVVNKKHVIAPFRMLNYSNPYLKLGVPQ